MARRAATLDLLLALALGIAMQVELLFVDAPRRDVLIARAAVLALAVALAVRRRLPVSAAAVALVVITIVERLDPSSVLPTARTPMGGRGDDRGGARALAARRRRPRVRHGRGHGPRGARRDPAAARGAAPRGRGAGARSAAVARAPRGPRGARAGVGLPVELDVEGERCPLPSGVDLTAYRLVQEALAAALHADDPRTAAVRLRYADDELAVEVTDVGETPPEGERALLGMHERVALYGGELVTEPLDGSGYAVRARLPLEVA
jgi:hypothetical protein